MVLFGSLVASNVPTNTSTIQHTRFGAWKGCRSFYGLLLHKTTGASADCHRPAVHSRHIGVVHVQVR